MRKLRVLIQNRAAAFIVPGGDTVVMHQLHEELSKLDVDVKLCAGERDVSEFDLVHIVNLTIGDEARRFRENCNQAGKPYVLTALYEDWPRYVRKSIATIPLFRDYLRAGRNQMRFDAELKAIRNTSDGPVVENREVLRDAAAVFACGATEAARLVRDYDIRADLVHTVHFGADSIRPASVSAIERVAKELGLDRFVLCCGRLETRKNQLMLLKALEHTGIPIVFAIGTASVQAPYVELVHQYAAGLPVRFVRKLESEAFAALMSAAAVHVLPSWFELPGLVSLEAALLGTPVVASSWGAITDYLTPHSIELCEPDDPASIHDAVRRALARGDGSSAATEARKFTWREFGLRTRVIYERVLCPGDRKSARQIPSETSISAQNNVRENAMNSATADSFRFDASIIIPCYNRVELTRECIESICANDPAANFEVIFVDNGSADDTVAMLKAIEGDVKLLRFSSNLGFAAACNAAARLAEGRFLVFLNNDTRPQSGWLDALMSCAKRHEHVGAVGGLLTYPDGTVQHAGLAFNDRKIPYHVFQNFRPDHPAVNTERRMNAVTAACMLVPNSVFAQLDGLDQGYVNGFEDVDFCLRLQEAGLACYYTPECKVVHHEESSPGRKDHDRENLERFTQKWANKVQSDEQELLAQYGMTITWGEHGGTYGQLATNSVTVPAATANPVNSDSLFDQAQSLYSDGNFRGAADLLQRIVESRLTLANEDGFETWQTLGNCLTRLNETASAEQAYYEAIRLNGESERPYLGLGTIAMLEENWLAAQYSFMTALAKNPNALKGEFGVGLSLAARNRHDAAIARFERVLENDPDNAEALFYLYRSAMEANKPEAALPHLENYVAQNPDDTNFLFNLCGAYWKAGLLTRAVETCRRVLELDANHAAAHEIMAHFEKSLMVDA
ncbi:glycosyltransferase [candidate division KSB1 bacterium]|nr:glycosyltransferase [candidate division KSB1 bacterium]